MLWKVRLTARWISASRGHNQRGVVRVLAVVADDPALAQNMAITRVATPTKHGAYTNVSVVRIDAVQDGIISVR